MKSWNLLFCRIHLPLTFALLQLPFFYASQPPFNDPKRQGMNLVMKCRLKGEEIKLAGLLHLANLEQV